MSSLHGTQATFDPLSAADDTLDGAFTTVFDSTPAAAAAPPSPPSERAAAEGAAAGNGGGGGGSPSMAPSEYDSFMTARSGLSYMTASHGGGAAAPPPAAVAPSSSPFRRLPDRPTAVAAPPSPSYFGLPGDNDHQQPSQLTQPFQPLVLDDSNPFASAAPAPAAAAAPPPPAMQQRPATAAMGPLSFRDDSYSSAAAAPPTDTAAAFAMPLDLYDTPDDAFAPRPVAAAAPAAAPLPPLYDFTREFAREYSRMLPVSEDPASPPDTSVAAGVAWYDKAGGSGGGGQPSGAAGSATPSFAAAAGSGGSAVAGGGGGSAAAAAGGAWAAPGSAASGGGGLTSYAAAALLTNTVSVHSPKRMVAPSRIPGLSEPYTSYSITSRSAISPETTVDRRFRDVVALAELLQSLYPGCFVPPRPSRHAVEGRRMQPPFIEERRAGIEKFLRRLVVHPVLGPSEATQVWLHTPSADLRASPDWLRLQPPTPPSLAKSTARLLFQVVGRERTVPSPVDVTRPASEAGDVYRLVHERAAQMRGVLEKVQRSPAEDKLREEAAALQDRTEALLTLSRRADIFVAQSAKAGRAGGKLGAALAAEAEGEAAAEAAAPGAVGPTPAAALRVAAEGLERVSKLYGVATDASAKHLTPLHDWLAAVPGCTTALAARERCLLTAATLAADEAEARSRLAEAEAKWMGGGGGGGGGAGVASPPPAAATKKIESLRLQVSQLAVSYTAAKDEYERVGSRNTSELATFKAQMSRELADAVREFALVQLAAAQKAHDLWAETAGKLATLAAAAAAVTAAAAGPGGFGGGSGGAAGGSGSSGVAIGVAIGGGGGGFAYGNS